MVDEIICICITALIFAAAVFVILRAIGKELPMLTRGRAVLSSLGSVALGTAIYGLWRIKPTPPSLAYCCMIWAILLANTVAFWLRIGTSRGQLTRVQARVIIVLWAVSLSAVVGIVTG